MESETFLPLDDKSRDHPTFASTCLPKPEKMHEIKMLHYKPTLLFGSVLFSQPRVAMKTTVVLTLLILNWAPAFADTFSVPDVGVSIDLPEGWTHDPSDGFGYLIRPPKNASAPRMRIHKLSHVGISPEEAIGKGIEKVNGIRVARKEAKETLISSEHFRTQSGIDGARGVIGPGDDYLNRYYFKHPKTDVMFCVCIYKSRNHAELTKTLEDAIKQSLRITKPAKGK